jgi:DHA2 family multidrug resistance protein
MVSAKDIENRWPIMAALMLSTLMNALDTTIANVALPHMQGSVSAAQDQITWVLTSYIIAAGLMTPLSGWLAQKIGRKRMFMYSIVGFTAASMLCGVATSLPEIVLFRLLQGVAGASVIPLSQSVMLDLFPPSQIPTVMAVWSANVIIGPVAGPVIGGWLTENLSWRWCFFINVPIGALAFAGVYLFMDRDEGGRQRPFDFLGFGALVSFIAGLQLMLDRGPSQDWFASKEIWVEATMATVGLWVFAVQTFTSEYPFFHRDLAKDRNFVTTTIFGFLSGALLFSSSALLPSMMQNLMGYSALQSGYASAPRGLGSLVSFTLAPFLLQRVGPRATLLAGIAISIVAFWQMSQFDLMMTSGPIMISGLIQGVSNGLLFTPLATLAYATLSPVHRTEGAVISTMARSLGSSLGISAMQAGLINQTAAAHSVLAGHVQPSSPVYRSVNPGFMNPLDPLGVQLLNGEVTRQAGMIAYDAVFEASIFLAGCMIPLLLLLRPPARGAGSGHIEVME